jgi:1-acyl-sn-glycerol-3-phosphate acyltransferase
VATTDREAGQLYPVAKAIITPAFRFAWRFHTSGIENVPTDGPAIICPNHTSVLDSFFVPTVLPRRITYVGKSEYMDSWKTKHLFPAMGMIPIDRGGGSASERALAAAERVLQRGELFGIYPEGTRSRDGRLYKGHTGPARLALRTGAPIIPVGIRGSREVMPPDSRFPQLFRPVVVRFGRPVRVERYQHRSSDRMVLRQIIDEVMFSIRELSGQDYVGEYATKRAEVAPAEVARIGVPSDVGTGRGANGNGHEAHGDAVERPRRTAAAALAGARRQG